MVRNHNGLSHVDIKRGRVAANEVLVYKGRTLVSITYVRFRKRDSWGNTGTTLPSLSVIVARDR